jgi:hypothetical protein
MAGDERLPSSLLDQAGAAHAYHALVPSDVGASLYVAMVAVPSFSGHTRQHRPARIRRCGTASTALPRVRLFGRPSPRGGRADAPSTARFIVAGWSTGTSKPTLRDRGARSKAPRSSSETQPPLPPGLSAQTQPSRRLTPLRAAASKTPARGPPTPRRTADFVPPSQFPPGRFQTPPSFVRTRGSRACRRKRRRPSRIRRPHPRWIKGAHGRGRSSVIYR